MLRKGHQPRRPGLGVSGARGAPTGGSGQKDSTDRRSPVCWRVGKTGASVTKLEIRFAIFGAVVAVASLAVAVAQFAWPARLSDQAREISGPTNPMNGQSSSTIGRLMRWTSAMPSVTFIESLTGPARVTRGGVRVYDVNGCRFSIYTQDGATADGMKVRLTPECDFDWHEMYEGFEPGRAFGTTVGQLAKHGSHQFKWDCLFLCQRSDWNFRAEFLPAGLAQDDLQYAAYIRHEDAWEAIDRLIERHGEVRGGVQPCIELRRDRDELIARELANIRIGAVVLGTYFNDYYEGETMGNESLGPAGFGGFPENATSSEIALCNSADPPRRAPAD